MREPVPLCFPAYVSGELNQFPAKAFVAGKTLDAAVSGMEELEANARFAHLMRGHDPRLLADMDIRQLDIAHPHS